MNLHAAQPEQHAALLSWLRRSYAGPNNNTIADVKIEHGHVYWMYRGYHEWAKGAGIGWWYNHSPVRRP